MALSPITINSNAVKQPTYARDYRINIQNDNMALDGATQRNRIVSASNPVGYKYAVDLYWENLSVPDFTTLLGFFSSGSGVVYSNPSSKYGILTYSGLPSVDEPDPYLAGESLLSNFKVTIRQV